MGLSPTLVFALTLGMTTVAQQKELVSFVRSLFQVEKEVVDSIMLAHYIISRDVCSSFGSVSTFFFDITQCFSSMC